MIDKCSWSGLFKIKILNKDGTVQEETIKNMIMDSVINELARTLEGESVDLEIKYLALGTDDTAVSADQTGLGNEIFRVPRTDIDNVDTGEIETQFILRYNEANQHIKEIGIFVGTTATATPESGKMLSRILWDKNKNENMEFVFTRTDLISRG